MKESHQIISNLRLRREREQRYWSQEQLAQRIGTTALNISRWERGITFPGLHFRQKLCELLQKSPQELGLIQVGVEVSEPQDHSASVNRDFVFPISSEIIYD